MIVWKKLWSVRVVLLGPTYAGIPVQLTHECVEVGNKLPLCCLFGLPLISNMVVLAELLKVILVYTITMALVMSKF